MSKEEQFVQTMFGYIIFMSWIGFFCLGFFVNEVLTNYSLCKKDKNRNTSQTVDCCRQTEKAQLSYVENVR